MIFTEQEMDDIRRMIQSHEIETGEKPLVVQWPLPKAITFNGIPVKFYLGDKAYTRSDGKVFHHMFPDPELKGRP